ncbi:MAG: acetyl-CoA carboxylase biotin carboxyl carrier protein [Armatimonadota bacterium]
MDDAIFIEVQRLCQLVHQRSLRELSVTRSGFSVSLSTLSSVVVAEATPLAVPHPVHHIAPPHAAPVIEEAPKQAGAAVVSPLVGIFYRSSSPDAPPFVEVGEHVDIGQVIGVVEAMKVFNEITSDVAGTVLKIPAENGKLVQVNDPLIVVETRE